MTASVPHQGSSRRSRSGPPRTAATGTAAGRSLWRSSCCSSAYPCGYLVISANQSRDSGKDKEKKYSATGLTAHWPSRVQQRLYQVPIPPYSKHVAYYETNNWKTSRLYVQFYTSNEGLESFLNQIGVSTGDLDDDEIAIHSRDRRIVGWDFTGTGPWYGLVNDQKNPAPTHDIVVNRSNPDHPMVYVVSRTVP